MEQKNIKYVVVLSSVHTGENIHLGISFKSYEEAKKDTEGKVCLNCNRFVIHQVPSDYIWLDRLNGFVSQEMAEAIMKEKQTKKDMKFIVMKGGAKR
jgi:hypothetical protein